jgi:hypothetical protein
LKLLNPIVDANGLVPVADAHLFERLQLMLETTHKPTDNWTRDRGCTLHGAGRCSFACSVRHRVPVPTAFKLVKAFRNGNANAWRRYNVTKQRLAEDCSHSVGGVDWCGVDVKSAWDLEAPLDTACNEWRVFHGTSEENGRRICATNFKQSLAGTGAVWSGGQGRKSTPLYGFGIYFAENVTKADEYCQPQTGDDSDEDGLCAMLVCRVVGGRVNVVTTNEIDIEKLRAENFQGPFDSVLGDRVSVLKKPFREIVVYDSDQIFPEFLLLYKRSYEQS